MGLSEILSDWHSAKAVVYSSGDEMSAEEGRFKSRGEEGQRRGDKRPRTHSGTSRLLALSGWREPHPAYTHIPQPTSLRLPTLHT